MAKDPVVSAHYAAFHIERARIVRLDHDRSMHVSYRLGNRVFWSKRKLKLPKGEFIITDGVRTARTRCGNQIAESIMAPISPQEPPPEQLNTPNGIDIGNAFHPAAAPVPDPGGPTTDKVQPSAGNDPPGDPGSPVPTGSPAWFPIPSPPTVVKVPEPGTGLLLLTALPALWFLRRHARKHERKSGR